MAAIRFLSNPLFDGSLWTLIDDFNGAQQTLAEVSCLERFRLCKMPATACSFLKTNQEIIQKLTLNSFQNLKSFFLVAKLNGSEVVFLEKFVFPQANYEVVQRIGDYPVYYKFMRYILFKGAQHDPPAFPSEKECSHWLWRFASRGDNEGIQFIIDKANNPDIVAMAVEEALRADHVEIVRFLALTKSDTILASDEGHLLQIFNNLLEKKLFDLFRFLSEKRSNESLEGIQPVQTALDRHAESQDAEIRAFVPEERIRRVQQRLDLSPYSS